MGTSKRTYNTREIVNEIKKIREVGYIETPKLEFINSPVTFGGDEMLSFDVFTESGMYKFYFTKLNYDDGIIVSIYGDLNNTITVESKIKS